MVRLGGGIDNGLRPDRSYAVFDGLRKVRSQCQGECAEVGFIAAAGEGAVEWLLPSETFADPANGFGLDLGRKLRTAGGCQLRIERSDQRLRQNASVGGRRIHQAKVVGRAKMKSAVDHLLRGLPQKARELVVSVAVHAAMFGGLLQYPGLGHSVAQRLKRALFHGCLYRASRERLKVVVDQVNQLVAELAPSSEVQFKVALGHNTILGDLECCVDSRCLGDCG